MYFVCAELYLCCLVLCKIPSYEDTDFITVIVLNLNFVLIVLSLSVTGWHAVHDSQAPTLTPSYILDSFLLWLGAEVDLSTCFPWICIWCWSDVS